MGKGMRMRPDDTVTGRNSNHEPAAQQLEPPDWLVGLAREEWDRIIPHLIRVGRVHATDQMIIAAYCQTYAQWREVTDSVMRDGTTISTPTSNGGTRTLQNPDVITASRYLHLLMQFSRQYGFSPSARNGIKMPTKGSRADDDFDEFVKEGHEQHDKRDNEEMGEDEG